MVPMTFPKAAAYGGFQTPKLDHTRLAQPRDLRPIVAQHLDQDLLRMLAELGCDPARLARRSAESYRHPEHLHRAAPRMLVVDDVTIGDHLRIVGQLGD